MKFSQTKSSVKFLTARGLVLLVCFAVLAAGTLAQRKVTTVKSIDRVPEAAVAPIVFNGQVLSCGDLNAIPDTSNGGAFTKITSDDQLTLNFQTPNGVFQFMNYTSPQGQVVLTGTQPTPIRSLSVASSGATVTNFSSQIQILAVNVVAGSSSYVFSYAYPNSAITYSDINLATGIGGFHPVTQVNFCYGVSVSPSAAPVSLSGRVMDASGRGVSGSTITVLNPNSGAAIRVRSNPFGYYTVTGLPAGELFVVTIIDKRYTFSNDTRSVTLNEDLADMDFIANPE